MNHPLPKPKNFAVFCDKCGEVLVNTRPGEMTCANCGGKVFSLRRLKRDKRQVFQDRDPRQHGPI